MIIENSRVGTVEFEEEDLIRFPSGLVGLSSRRRFLLLDFDEDVPLAWLQCIDDPNFGLPVAEPGIFVPDYQIEASRETLAELEIDSVEEVAILVVTTVHAGGVMVTGNLRAPLLVNTRNRVGRQVVFDRNDLELRALVDPVAFAQAPLPTSTMRGETAANQSVVG